MTVAKQLIDEQIDIVVKEAHLASKHWKGKDFEGHAMNMANELYLRLIYVFDKKLNEPRINKKTRKATK